MGGILKLPFQSNKYVYSHLEDENENEIRTNDYSFSWSFCQKIIFSFALFVSSFIFTYTAVTFLTPIILRKNICSKNDNIHTNPDYIRASAYLLDTVDLDVDPCEDFYAFACGNFMKNAFSREQRSTLMDLNKLAHNNVKQIVIQSKNDSDLPIYVRLQRKFFKSCIDTQTNDYDGNEAILILIEEVLGGSPFDNNSDWKEEIFDWSKAIIKARKLGLFHEMFFKIDVYDNTLWIKPLNFYEIMYFDKYEIAEQLGIDEEDIAEEIESINAFADSLKNIITDYDTSLIFLVSQNRTFIKDFNNVTGFDWVYFLREITGNNVTGEDEVIYDNQYYFIDLYGLLFNTPKRILASYMALVILSNTNTYLPNLNNEGSNEMCYQLSIDQFPMIAEYEYIRQYATPEKRRQVKDLINYIKSEVKESIETTKWINGKDRSGALNRLHQIICYIGWLDFVFNVTQMKEYTGFNKITEFPENITIIDLTRIVKKARYDKLYTQTFNGDIFKSMDMDPIDVNAYYIDHKNILFLPASIIQREIFDIHRPHYMNFGALGSVIGHEFSHGFGLLGEFSDSLVWTKKSQKQRYKIKKCVENEYSKFCDDHGIFMIDATSSTDETTADISGVNLAYKAYHKWKESNGPEPGLPGIDLTPNQIFWIMTSSYMCTEPGHLDTLLCDNDVHATPSFRVEAMVKNSPFFASDFNCPIGSRMNPLKKCHIFS